jgi:hypothetical protein
MNESLLIKYFRPSYPWPSHFRPITTFDQLKYLTEWHLRIDLKYFFFKLIGSRKSKKPSSWNQDVIFLYFEYWSLIVKRWDNYLGVNNLG